MDDHEDSLELYGLALDVSGFTPVLARSVDEGWALACVTPPATIVTDLAIPHVDGWAFIQRLRTDLSATLPIIVLSGRGDNATVRARALAAGGHAVLVSSSRVPPNSWQTPSEAPCAWGETAGTRH